MRGWQCLIVVGAATLVCAGFDADPSVPASGLGSFAGLMSEADGDERLAVSLYGNYAHRPVMFTDGRPALTHLLSTHLTVGWRPFKQLTLEAGVPLSFVPPTVDDVLYHGFRLRDLRARARWAVWRASGVSLAVIPSVRVLTGPMVLGLEGVLGAGLAGQVSYSPVRWLTLVGESGVNGATSSWSSIDFKAGAAWRPLPWLNIPLELQGLWYLGPDPIVDIQLPVEARLTPTIRLGPVELGAVLGAGLTAGVGAPRLRAGASVAFVFGDAERTAAPLRPAAARAAEPASADSSPSTRIWEIEVRDSGGRTLDGAISVDDKPCTRSGARMRCQAPIGEATLDVHAHAFLPVRMRVSVDALPDVVVLFALDPAFAVRQGGDLSADGGAERSRRLLAHCVAHFATDRFELEPDEQERLTACLDQRDGAPDIEVVGHADHRGTDNANFTLSGRRASTAAAVVSSLYRGAKVRVVARGELDASTTNADDAELRADRRVDVLVYAHP